MIYPEVTKKKRVRGNVIVNIFRPIQMFVFKEFSAQKKGMCHKLLYYPISGVYPACTIIAFA